MPTTVDKDKVRLSLDVSPELNQLLDSLATRTHESKSDVLRKAIVLMDVAVKASQEGKRLLLEEPATPLQQQPNVTEIVGLFPPGAPRRQIGESVDRATWLDRIEQNAVESSQPGVGEVSGNSVELRRQKGIH